MCPYLLLGGRNNSGLARWQLQATEAQHSVHPPVPVVTRNTFPNPTLPKVLLHSCLHGAHFSMVNDLIKHTVTLWNGCSCTWCYCWLILWNTMVLCTILWTWFHKMYICFGTSKSFLVYLLECTKSLLWDQSILASTYSWQLRFLWHAQLLRKGSIICTTWGEQALTDERLKESPSCGPTEAQRKLRFPLHSQKVKSCFLSAPISLLTHLFSACIPDHWWKPPGICWLPLHAQLYVEWLFRAKTEFL